MRLSTIPNLPPEFISPLERQGVRTDADFLPMQLLDILEILPSGTATLAQIKKYKDVVAEYSSASGLSAKSLLESTLNVPFDAEIGLPSSLASVSHVLSAHSGRVVELSGNRGSKNSEFALNIVLGFLSANISHTAYWVDTVGDFSPEKAAQIASSIKRSGSQACLDRMRLSLALEIEELYGILDAIVSSSLSDDGAIMQKTGYLVIDSITPLLGPLLSASSSQGHTLMMGLMRQLRMISQAHSITVVVINHSAASFWQHDSRGIERKPALGPTFTFLTDVTLWTNQQSEADSSSEDGCVKYHIHVLKSSATAAKICGSFKLRSGLFVLPDP